MGNRPTDWHVLDLEEDPVPGDPERVKSLARRLHDFADDVGDALRQIKGMAGDDALLKWAGKSADAFTAEFEDVPKNLRKLKKSYDLAGDALAAYWPDLDKAQDDSRRALEKGREARRNLSSANTRLDTANGWVDRASKKAKEYEDSGKKKDVPPPDEKDVRAATRNATNAKDEQRDAQTAVDNAQNALDAAKKMAADAKKLREDAATKAKKKLEEASDAGIENRSWWEEGIDWVSDNWDTIVAVCKVVVAIVGIIAMIIGGPILAAIVVVAALVVLADTINKYMKGQAGLLDVAFAALDCIPGMKGLTTLGGLAKGLKGMAKGLRGGGLKALRKGLDNVIGKSKPTKGRCKGGDPIDMVSGEMLMEETDVELPGLLPLVLRRTHLSTYRWGRWYGESWASTLDERLELDNEGALFATEDGMILAYPVPAPGTSVMPLEGPQWPLDWDGEPGAPIRITNPHTGHTRHFAPLAKTAPVDAAFTMPLAAISDRNNHRITIDRDDTGTPTAVRHSGGYHIHIDTDDDRITSLRLANPEDGPDGTTLLRYGYDEDGHLTEIYNSSGLPFQLAYDERSRITQWTDRNNSWYRFTYDDHDRCIQGEGAGGFLNCTITYDTENRRTRYTNSLGHTTTHHYNELLQRTAVTDPLGNIEHSQWDTCNRLISRTDALGRITRFSYDTAGNAVSMELPNGNRTSATYDSRNMPVRVQYSDDSYWHQEFDDHGNLTSVVDPLGAVTRFGYNPLGHRESVTDPLGNTAQITTNPAGLIATVTSPSGAITSMHRDAFGRVKQVIDAVGGETHFDWTPEGRPARRVLPNGSIETWTHDGEGNLVEHVGPSGEVTRISYTHFRLPSAKSFPDGAAEDFRYDTELRLLSVANGNELTWAYDYDAAGRLASERDFNGRTVRYTTDAAGQITAWTPGVGLTTQLAYDVLGNVVEKVSGNSVTTYEYDRTGRLRQAMNADAVIEFVRDARGNVVSEACNGQVLTHKYNSAGRQVERRTPSGALSNWEYDSSHRLRELSMTGHSITFNYDQAGREVERTIGTSAVLTQKWTAGARLASQTLTNEQTRDASRGIKTDNAHVLQHRTYAYREDGFLTRTTDEWFGERVYDLDPTGRVRHVNSPAIHESYAYDSMGNLTFAQWAADHKDSADHHGKREFSGTLIKRAGRTVYQHDEDGRVVLRTRRLLSGGKRTWSYTWDADDRLTGLVTPDGTQWTYQYDPLGRRIGKQRLARDGTVEEIVHFTWDGSVLCEQRVQRPLRNGTEADVTVWEWDPERHRPLVQREFLNCDMSQNEVDERFYSIVTDVIGTPTELVDEKGNIVWRNRTTLWGVSVPGGPVHEVQCPLRFPGQYHDPESGLHYNYFRYYDPETARYYSPDPLGLDPAPNHHAYVPNPLTWIDPLGLECGDGLPEGYTSSPALCDDVYCEGAVKARSDAWRQHFGQSAASPTDELDRLARQARNEVRRGRGPDEVHRIDPPEETVPGSKWHAQKKGTGSPALNQDGTFHDGDPRFSNKTMKWLRKYGWKDPE
ncbi:RHS repeat-associated core domain-containing protein [Streptomyces sp. NPDC047108]|uniref:RHS repeat-associated core domain-containing protein n=1 Tax=Streptomyces sp. NPDC047108 TaxID=3155025 RepID=UPI0033FC85A1